MLQFEDLAVTNSNKKIPHSIVKKNSVMYQVSHVTYDISTVKKIIKWLSKLVKGLLSTEPTPSSFIVYLKQIKTIVDKLYH